MQSNEYLKEIKKYFASFITEVDCNIACGHFDINSVAENFYIPILKIIFECQNLQNKNIIKRNFPAIDLGCKGSRKSFQITADNGSTKIIQTLEKFRKHNLNNDYDEVYILIITTKQNSYSSQKLKEEIKKHSINFDPKTHIIDYKDLLSKISNFDFERLKEIYEILEKEFSQKKTFNICRDELDKFLLFSNDKISYEKKTKKYIPSIFTESTKTKDLARLFAHPLFFYRKVDDKLHSVSYNLLNEYLAMMGLQPISFTLHEFLDQNTPKSIQDISSYLNTIKTMILCEKNKIKPYNQWGRNREDFTVPHEKKAIKSLLKIKLNSHCFGLNKNFDEILDLIKLSLSQIFLVTSMAGQGKTNFVCDLIENQFKLFEIPSIFIPARELNSITSPLKIFNHLIKNRYLSETTNIHQLLSSFEKISKEIDKPFIIVIDGINEVKDLNAFNAEICDFLNDISQFDYIKVIVTCRSEFFERRFSSILNQSFSDSIYHIEDLKADMSEENLERLLKAYWKCFKITLELSDNASKFLKNDLLLLRIFCELNQGKDIGLIREIYKNELYEEYLIRQANSFPDNLKKKVVPTLYLIAEKMIENDHYTALSLNSFNADQLKIIEQLVSEDIILRREIPDARLATVGDEAVGFIYDELRDFLIAYYLVEKLSVEDFNKFSSFLVKLRDLQIYEGVFKYLYILSRKVSRDNILKLCESFPSFEEHYSIILSSLPVSYQSKYDIDRVKAIFDSCTSYAVVKRVALYLHSRKSKDEFLNIRILVDHINNLNDKDLNDFLNKIFSARNDYGHEQNNADDMLRDYLKKLEVNQQDFDNNAFIFCLQTTVICSSQIQYEALSVYKKIKENGQRLDCFEYIDEAKSDKLKKLSSLIKN